MRGQLRLWRVRVSTEFVNTPVAGVTTQKREKGKNPSGKTIIIIIICLIVAFSDVNNSHYSVAMLFIWLDRWTGWPQMTI